MSDSNGGRAARWSGLARGWRPGDGLRRQVSGEPCGLPAHFCGRIKKFHFVATVAKEQEELLGERGVPDHARGVVALVGLVDVQDFQVVSAALEKIVLYLQRSPDGHSSANSPNRGRGHLASWEKICLDPQPG